MQPPAEDTPLWHNVALAPSKEDLQHSPRDGVGDVHRDANQLGGEDDEDEVLEVRPGVRTVERQRHGAQHHGGIAHPPHDAPAHQGPPARPMQAHHHHPGAVLEEEAAEEHHQARVHPHQPRQHRGVRDPRLEEVEHHQEGPLAGARAEHQARKEGGHQQQRRRGGEGPGLQRRQAVPPRALRVRLRALGEGEGLRHVVDSKAVALHRSGARHPEAGEVHLRLRHARSPHTAITSVKCAHSRGPTDRSQPFYHRPDEL
eukprot:762886-Hanusia_phi.AAC.2